MDNREVYRRRSQSRTTAINSDHILTKILVRLPTKSLIQLKSVCRRWRDLISDHHFSVVHTLRHGTTTAHASALILLRRPYKYYYLSLQQPTKTRFTLSGFVIQSCHGLLLCRFREEYSTDYYIYNLATRVHRTLNIDRGSLLGLALAFDPSRSAYYKIIRVTLLDFVENYLSRRYIQIDAFDPESSTWSVVVEKATASCFMNWSKGIYWNNSIHWEDEGGSVYVDLDRVVFAESPKVPAIFWRRYNRDSVMQLLVESGGHLHLIIHDGSQCSITELERDYSRWTFKYCVEYSRIGNALPDNFLLGIVHSEDQSFLLFSVPGKLMAYNISDESSEEVIQLRKEGWYSTNSMICYNNHHLFDNVHQFVATLAPV